jgi:hypothetical protein
MYMRAPLGAPVFVLGIDIATPNDSALSSDLTLAIFSMNVRNSPRAVPIRPADETRKP